MTGDDPIGEALGRHGLGEWVLAAGWPACRAAGELSLALSDEQLGRLEAWIAARRAEADDDAEPT